MNYRVQTLPALFYSHPLFYSLVCLWLWSGHPSAQDLDKDLLFCLPAPASCNIWPCSCVSLLLSPPLTYLMYLTLWPEEPDCPFGRALALSCLSIFWSSTGATFPLSPAPGQSSLLRVAFGIDNCRCLSLHSSYLGRG